MATHQIIVHTSEIQNSREVISLLKNSHNLQVQVKPELKVGFLISPRLGVNKGQLISKCPFAAIVWTKIPTKTFDNFCPRILKVVKSP